jgi:transposase
VACRRLVAGRKIQTQIRRFATTTRGLLELADWLEDGKVTHVAMEATGIYWKPVWHVLHGRFTLILANAAHIRNVPGRKSDVNDATWIAELLAHGLIRASFVPPQPIQELRDLTRTRKELTREIVRHTAAHSCRAGGGEHQAGVGDHRYSGLVRATHAPGHCGWRNRRGASGRPRQFPGLPPRARLWSLPSTVAFAITTVS